MKALDVNDDPDGDGIVGGVIAREAQEGDDRRSSRSDSNRSRHFDGAFNTRVDFAHMEGTSGAVDGAEPS